MFKGWNIPMIMMLSPVTMAETPASRMSVDAVIFDLFLLIEVFPLVFICLSPLLNHKISVRDWHSGIAACLGSIEYNIQMNVGSCLPQMWGLRVGRFGDDAKNPPEKFGGFFA